MSVKELIGTHDEGSMGSAGNARAGRRSASVYRRPRGGYFLAIEESDGSYQGSVRRADGSYTELYEPSRCVQRTYRASDLGDLLRIVLSEVKSDDRLTCRSDLCEAVRRAVEEAEETEAAEELDRR